LTKEKADELRQKGEKSLEESREKLAESIKPKEKKAAE
jgi:ElaB/YqjD/DUF883 family membrane-anchored ribosome-binding protein